MSRHKQFRPDRINDYSLRDRPSKVHQADFAKPFTGDSFQDFLASLPEILAGAAIKDLAQRIAAARSRDRAIIWALGGHVIKTGLAPLFTQLLREGFLSAIAVNGSVIIHDFEIAYCGSTSENVEEQLGSGAFGMARETGQFLNEAINRGADQDIGIGEAVGRYLQSCPLEFPDSSLVLQAYQQAVPLTVHAAYGTDIIHNHPRASGVSLGKGTEIDYRIFTQEVSRLHDGGVFINVGSAVLLPEVFLKAVSAIRNSGQELSGFSTANFDFVQHYRPTQNVVNRPVEGDGKGFAITGHHELTIPLLAGILLSLNDPAESTRSGS